MNAHSWYHLLPKIDKKRVNHALDIAEVMAFEGTGAATVTFKGQKLTFTMPECKSNWYGATAWYNLPK